MLQLKIPDASAKTWLRQINEKKKKFFLNLLFTSHQVYGILLTAACADGHISQCTGQGAQHGIAGPLCRVPQSCSQGVKKQSHHFANKVRVGEPHQAP